MSVSPRTLRDAWKEQVAALIAANGELVLNGETYRAARFFDGITRAVINTAIDDLVRSGRAELVSGRGPLVVRLTEAVE